MNDISLTGCFLNDIQSPEKPSKNGNMSQILNENSRDALFFNVIFIQFLGKLIKKIIQEFFFACLQVDTIMEILPSNVIRYEDKGVIE